MKVYKQPRLYKRYKFKVVHYVIQDPDYGMCYVFGKRKEGARIKIDRPLSMKAHVGFNWDKNRFVCESFAEERPRKLIRGTTPYGRHRRC